MFRSFSYLFLFSSQSRQIPPVMCRQVPDQDHYYRSDHHGRHSAPQPVYPNTGNGPYNRRTGINMAHKNIWRYSCHHITDQPPPTPVTVPRNTRKNVLPIYPWEIPLSTPITVNTPVQPYPSPASPYHRPAGSRLPEAPVSSTSLQKQYRTSLLPQWYTADPETFPAARFPG